MKRKTEEKRATTEIIRVSGDGTRLNVFAAAANEMTFSVEVGGLDYLYVLADVLKVLPALMRRDVELTEGADNGSLGRQGPNTMAQATITAFRRRYFERISDPLGTLEGMI